MLAFIINIGLFVKAKINLQNAVDAAAFSGAATQARQLTNMAYLNWELRNTYKEWMFKNYVLGQLGQFKGQGTLTPGKISGSTNVSYLLRADPTAGTNIGFDKFNVPSSCIHNNSSADICPIYVIPGIPRFSSVGVAGISEIHESFVNELSKQKSTNCVVRTKINFLAALSWAYSSGLKESAGAPMIATNRPGAWTESLELAMRMRNLEMIANRPPVEEMNFDMAASMSSIGASVGLNERPVKAFSSAFRNLGGGKYKDKLFGAVGANANKGIDELAATFRLTEIAPQPYTPQNKNVSNFLIPEEFEYPGTNGIKATKKHYVDLQIVPVNYAPLFSTFSPSSNRLDADVEVDSSCFISKTALPVPGYIMGFVKNPTMVTYYAVKGEAQFTGLFFPRTSESQPGSFKLTAYAAAKPFGGRIGPKIFGFEPAGEQAVVARSDEFSSSTPFYSGLGLGVAGLGSAPFVPGETIPSSSDFWAGNTTTEVGGIPRPGSNTPTKYGIPNMIYDFNSESDLAIQASGSVGNLMVIAPQMSATSSTSQRRGLYDSFQIRRLKEALGGNFEGQDMTGSDLMRAIVRARQVTRYDAVNYLIPDIARPSGGASPNAAPTVRAEEQAVPGGVGIYYKLFAPLLGDSLLYKSTAEVEQVVISYLGANESAIENYLRSLLSVSKRIYNLPSVKEGAPNLNREAGLNIHANAGMPGDAWQPVPFSSAGDPMDEKAPGCRSDMASKFAHFFTGHTTQCGIVPLEALVVEYIDKKNSGTGSIFYTTTYLNELPRDQIMTAYYPGPRQGTTPDSTATALGPIGTTTDAYSSRRNYYSTKFIPLSKVLATSNDYNEDVFLESDVKAPQDAQSLIPKNLIPADATTGLNNPYYLDF